MADCQCPASAHWLCEALIDLILVEHIVAFYLAAFKRVNIYLPLLSSYFKDDYLVWTRRFQYTETFCLKQMGRWSEMFLSTASDYKLISSNILLTLTNRKGAWLVILTKWISSFASGETKLEVCLPVSGRKSCMIVWFRY